jgi:hypothetical protein
MMNFPVDWNPYSDDFENLEAKVNYQSESAFSQHSLLRSSLATGRPHINLEFASQRLSKKLWQSTMKVAQPFGMMPFRRK